MKILVVEDETKIGDYLRQGLTEAGFTTDLARNGLDSHQKIKKKEFLLLPQMQDE